MSDTTNKGKPTSDVDAKVQAMRERVDATRQRISDVRVVLSEARETRDTLIGDAEKVYGEQYRSAYNSQSKELEDLNTAFGELRGEITDRWANEQASLSEARDVAVSAAQKAYDETVEATRESFGVSDD